MLVKTLMNLSWLLCVIRIQGLPLPSTERVPFLIFRGGDEESLIDTNSVSEGTANADQSKSTLDAFEFKASKPDDGSADDPDGIPRRYHIAHKSIETAKAAFDHTVEWRQEHDVNTILSRSHSKYDLCKSIFPVYISGRDRNNNIIIVQRVGLIDFSMAHKNNISGDDLIMHYVYMVEYCWNILEPSPEAVMTTVLDAKGVDFKTFTDNETRSFLRKFVKIMSDHYPSRSYRTMIINCPKWANMVYNFIKPVLRESTREKIMLLNGGKSQDDTLIEILGPDSVPSYLLSDESARKSKEEDEERIKNEPVHEPTIEENLRSFVTDCLTRHGDEMVVAAQ